MNWLILWKGRTFGKIKAVYNGMKLLSRTKSIVTPGKCVVQEEGKEEGQDTLDFYSLAKKNCFSFSYKSHSMTLICLVDVALN